MKFVLLGHLTKPEQIVLLGILLCSLLVNLRVVVREFKARRADKDDELSQQNVRSEREAQYKAERIRLTKENGKLSDQIGEKNKEIDSLNNQKLDLFNRLKSAEAGLKKLEGKLSRGQKLVSQQQQESVSKVQQSRDRDFELEREQLRRERDNLRGQNHRAKETIERLENLVKYYRQVLENEELKQTSGDVATLAVLQQRYSSRAIVARCGELVNILRSGWKEEFHELAARLPFEYLDPRTDVKGSIEYEKNFLDGMLRLGSQDQVEVCNQIHTLASKGPAYPSLDTKKHTKAPVGTTDDFDGDFSRASLGIRFTHELKDSVLRICTVCRKGTSDGKTHKR